MGVRDLLMVLDGGEQIEVSGLHCALVWSWNLSFLSPDRTTVSKCMKDVGPLKLRTVCFLPWGF